MCAASDPLDSGMSQFPGVEVGGLEGGAIHIQSDNLRHSLLGGGEGEDADTTVEIDDTFRMIGGQKSHDFLHQEPGDGGIGLVEAVAGDAEGADR